MKVREKILIIIAILLLITTIFRIHITINQPAKIVTEKQDDLKYWTEDVNPHDGTCHCPGGTMCTTCQTEPNKPCGCVITRLDIEDARRRAAPMLKELKKFSDGIGEIGG